MSPIPYKFDEGAAAKAMNALGSAARKGIELYGKAKAAPLAAEEELARIEQKKKDRKAKVDAAHADRVKKATELSNARAAGRIAFERERQKTIKAQTQLAKAKASKSTKPTSTSSTKPKMPKNTDKDGVLKPVKPAAPKKPATKTPASIKAPKPATATTGKKKK